MKAGIGDEGTGNSAKRIYPAIIRLMAAPQSWFRAATQRRRLEAEMEAELTGHLEHLTADLELAGYEPRVAARRARLALGSPAAHKDGMRRALGLRLWDELGADLRYAVRGLRKSPTFTVVAVASLALAIGANATLFSFVNQLLYVTLGVPHPQQLRNLAIAGDKHMVVRDSWGSSYTRDDGRFEITAFSYPVYRQLQRQKGAWGEIFAYKDLWQLNLISNGTPEVVQADVVSGNFYAQMQLKPQIGRPLLPSDDGAPGTGSAAVISDAYWHHAFGGLPSVLGKVVVVNTVPVTIVGVNPPSFVGPAGSGAIAPQIFLPMSLATVLHPGTGDNDPMGPDLWWVNLMARARDGVSDAQAKASLDVALSAAVRATMTVGKDDTVPTMVIEDGSHGDTMGASYMVKPMMVLLGMAGLVLLLATANVANLMLARMSRRSRELSVRMALGAGRTRVMRLAMVESLLIAGMGGAAGILLGFYGRELIPLLLLRQSGQSADFPIAFDWRVFGFTAGITLVSGLLFGMLPALRSTQVEVNTALKEGAQTATRRRKGLAGKSIVGFQVALSTLLVVSAALFLRTVINLNAIDPGFEAKHLLLFSLTPPAARYPAPKNIALHHRLEDTLAHIPGVQGVSLTTVPLVGGSMWSGSFYVQGAKPNAGEQNADLAAVGPDFFSTMSIPILAGRGFTSQDTETSQPVAVVNRALVKEFFPNTNPIGKRFRRDMDGPDAARWIEIVGVCGDTRYQNMKDPPPPIHFDLYRQASKNGPGIGSVTYLVRSTLGGDDLLPSIRRVVAQVDPDLPITEVRTQQQQIENSMVTERMFASLSAGFGALALALACVGIYGVMAYSVANRTNEIGIRLALGALPRQVMRMILRESIWLSLAGVAVGLGAALMLARLVKSMLYGLQPADPVSLLSGAALLVAVGLAASWIPARRAASVEPMEALRHE